MINYKLKYFKNTILFLKYFSLYYHVVYYNHNEFLTHAYRINY